MSYVTWFVWFIYSLPEGKISCHEMLQRDYRVCQTGLMPAQFLCVALFSSLSLSLVFFFFLVFFSLHIPGN